MAQKQIYRFIKPYNLQAAPITHPFEVGFRLVPFGDVWEVERLDGSKIDVQIGEYHINRLLGQGIIEKHT